MDQPDPYPDFSIIIPARNMERFIAETLDSVCRQSAPSFEVICLDDGSTDSTREIIEGFVRRDARFSVRSGPAKGVSAARNLGLSLAQAPLVLFLDADDLLHPDALRLYSQALSSSGAVAALSGVQRISIQGDEMRGTDNRLLVPEQDQLAALLRKNFVVNGGALALRTDVARQVGGYDTSLTNGEDWEFWCRAALIGPFHVMEGPALLYYRQVASGANFKTRAPAFARRVASIEKVAANPAMQQRFGPKLRRLLRARQIDVFWSGVRNQYQYGRKPRALFEGVCGMFMYPDSVLRPKLIWRFMRSLDRRA
ncbi:glycosyltransferase [Ruegeria sp. R14_0]|uniref:glycosyltransferase family 2 protein n=1 Tax=Ruegeria sp. R14_0 TaxID=2821100 RepID=UPI001ADA015C|nr:glycosyltransferase [Ruegeria sp. R14_0]MBO9445912.1 glycosyltransferase [Ruegeria sp. R14_0]